MNPESNFSSADSLALINRMIAQAKEKFADNSFDLLWWGWLIAGACLLQYGLFAADYSGSTGWVWIAAIGLGAAGSLTYNFRRARQEQAAGHRSVMSQQLGYLWASVGAGFGIATLVLFKVGYGPAYVFFLVLMGIGTTTTGSLLHFTPLRVGGGLCFGLALVALYLGDTLLLLPLMAGALVVSYIIPGHLLRAEARRQRTAYEQAATATPHYV